MRVSFSDTIGIFGIVMAIVLVVLDKAGKLKGQWLFTLLFIAGIMTLFIAIGNDWVQDAPKQWKWWRAIFMFCLVALAYSWVAIWIEGSPIENAEVKNSESNGAQLHNPGQTTQTHQTLSAEQIADAVASKLRTAPHSEPAKPAAKPSAPQIVRLGVGPDAYKDITDLQLIKWVNDEADKIESLAEQAMQPPQNGMSPNAMLWRFNNDFNDCCAQDLKDMRAELLRRLGPKGKDNDEIEEWTALFPADKYPMIPPNAKYVLPQSLRSYAGYFRRLAVRLKRRTVPRAAAKPLPFVETPIESDEKFSHRIVATITTKETIANGYIIVEFDKSPASIGTDFPGKYVMDWRLIDNRDFAEYVANLMSNRITYYALAIAGTPLTPSTPMHVVAAGANDFHVTKVTLFDE